MYTHKHIHTMEYYSVGKKNDIMPFVAIWMDPEIIILSKISQKEKDKYIWHHIYVEPKIWHKWTYLWNRNKLTDIERTDLCLLRGRRCGGRTDWEFGTRKCKLLYTEWINKALCTMWNRELYSISCNKPSCKIIWKRIYISITESLCCTPETNTTL